MWDKLRTSFNDMFSQEPTPEFKSEDEGIDLELDFEIITEGNEND